MKFVNWHSKYFLCVAIMGLNIICS